VPVTRLDLGHLQSRETMNARPWARTRLIQFASGRASLTIQDSTAVGSGSISSKRQGVDHSILKTQLCRSSSSLHLPLFPALCLLTNYSLPPPQHSPDMSSYSPDTDADYIHGLCTSLDSARPTAVRDRSSEEERATSWSDHGYNQCTSPGCTRPATMGETLGDFTSCNQCWVVTLCIPHLATHPCKAVRIGSACADRLGNGG
jgi:hypothetical protein